MCLESAQIDIYLNLRKIENRSRITRPWRPGGHALAAVEQGRGGEGGHDQPPTA
jgi:hypothetical protein